MTGEERRGVRRRGEETEREKRIGEKMRGEEGERNWELIETSGSQN